MKAAVLDKQGEEIKIYRDVDSIEPRAGEVKVRVKYCSLCHSDASVKSGVMGELSGPIILGHEAAGIVHSVGAGVAHLQPGDHVALVAAPPCGTCYFFPRNEHSLCVDGQGINTHAPPE
ncbi:MAG: alcohol dehydrogenase catalytic domain-containing protein, partial [Pseudomonadales bacterium]